MNTTTLPKQAGELASHVGETMTEAVSKGVERARDLVSSAEEHLPDSAVDWTRGHVPGLNAPPRHGRRNVLAIVLFVVALAGVTWWMRRRSSNGVAAHMDKDVNSASSSGSPGWRAA